MRFMLKELFSGSTDFTEAIFKVPEISKHFSAMLKPQGLFSWSLSKCWFSYLPHTEICNLEIEIS